MSKPVRIDKWLWAARFFKTRSLASDAIDKGKVRVGGERIKPARNVNITDILSIDNGSTKWEVQVVGLSDVRSSAPIAQALYAETTQSIVARQNDAEQKKFFHDPASTLKGRPDKHARRHLEKTQAGEKTD